VRAVDAAKSTGTIAAKAVKIDKNKPDATDAQTLSTPLLMNMVSLGEETLMNRPFFGN
jgi:hypothetical protein